jgi:signal-transduction protein with cAMP-binding, CBS, and nucleotidyltransferase domain
MILHDPVSRLNAPDPLVLREDDSVALAVERMKRLRYGSVLIVDDDEKLCGIFTEHDLVTNCVGREGQMDSIRLGDVMTREPLTLNEDDMIAQALSHMSVGGCRHVPLVRDGAPVGFVSIRGILKYLARSGALSDGPSES